MGKGAILDVDGTLLDSMPIWEDASSRFLAGQGIEAEEGLGDIMFRMSLDEGAEYLRAHYFGGETTDGEPTDGDPSDGDPRGLAGLDDPRGPGGPGDPRGRLVAGESTRGNPRGVAGSGDPRGRLVAGEGAAGDPRGRLVEWIKEGVLGVIRDFYFEQAQLKPGAREFLGELKRRGIPMYIATSSNREHIRAAFERLGVMDYFDGMITCEEAGAGKSDPRIFLMAAERMGLAPGEVYVFEDVIHAIRSANRGGFVSVGVYDAASDADNAAMRAESAIYIHSLENWEGFREAAEL